MSYDSKTNHFQAGVGVGFGGGVSVGNDNWDVGYSNDNYVDVGYDNKMDGGYIRAQCGTQGPNGTGVSGTYYPGQGEYQIGGGVGFWGNYGVNAGYSKSGGYSAGVSAYGVGTNYNFEDGTYNYSYNTGSWEVTVDLAGKVWAAPNTVMGLALGIAGSPFVLLSGKNPYMGINKRDNAINIRLPVGSAVSLGNVHLYGPGWSPNDITPGMSVKYRNYNIRTGTHEAGHTAQAQTKGPLYLPAYGIEYLFNVFRYGSFMGAYENHSMERGADEYAIRN